VSEINGVQKNIWTRVSVIRTSFVKTRYTTRWGGLYLDRKQRSYCVL